MNWALVGVFVVAILVWAAAFVGFYFLFGAMQ